MNKLSVQSPEGAGPELDFGRCHGLADSSFARVVAVFRCYWRTLVERNRREIEIARAIDQLHAANDAQLFDLGIRRADIEHAVRYGKPER